MRPVQKLLFVPKRADRLQHDLHSAMHSHYRLEDGLLLCGAADGVSTREPWKVTCRDCLNVARAESIDQPGPHPFIHTEHCSDCLSFGPRRRRDSKGWDGSW